MGLHSEGPEGPRPTPMGSSDGGGGDGDSSGGGSAGGGYGGGGGFSGSDIISITLI